jgi:predicted NAD/FAD-binding protein
VTAVLHLAALVTTAFGLVAAAVVLAAARRPMPALAVLLDFLTAAGLLRLAGEPSWDTIAAAAAVIAVRRLVTTGLRASHPH